MNWVWRGWCVEKYTDCALIFVKVGHLYANENRSSNEGTTIMIERIHVNERSSKIVKHNGVVYLTGQVADGDTIQDQVSICLQKIETLLDEAGSSKEQMLRVTIWLADMDDFIGLNEVWNMWVPDGHAPARACGQAKLAREELKVEFIVDAAYDQL